MTRPTGGSRGSITFKVLKVIDGDTIEVLRQGQAERVGLLYVDTAETDDNDHGKRMAEGEAAKAELDSIHAQFKEATLWAPGDEIKRDRFGRLLAVVYIGPTRVMLNSLQIDLGFSVYWRKYGDAPEPLHSDFQWGHSFAEKKSGAPGPPPPTGCATRRTSGRRRSRNMEQEVTAVSFGDHQALEDDVDVGSPLLFLLLIALALLIGLIALLWLAIRSTVRAWKQKKPNERKGPKP